MGYSAFARAGARDTLVKLSGRTLTPALSLSTWRGGKKRKSHESVAASSGAGASWGGGEGVGGGGGDWDLFADGGGTMSHVFGEEGLSGE